MDLDYDDKDEKIRALTLKATGAFGCPNYMLMTDNLEIHFDAHSEEQSYFATIADAHSLCMEDRLILKDIEADRKLPYLKGGKLKIMIKSKDHKIDLEKEYDFAEINGDYKLNIDYVRSERNVFYFDVTNNGNRGVPYITTLIYKGECEGGTWTIGSLSFKDKPQPGETKEGIMQVDTKYVIETGQDFCITFSYPIERNIPFKA